MYSFMYSSNSAILPAVYRDGEAFAEWGDCFLLLSGRGGK